MYKDGHRRRRCNPGTTSRRPGQLGSLGVFCTVVCAMVSDLERAPATEIKSVSSVKLFYRLTKRQYGPVEFCKISAHTLLRHCPSVREYCRVRQSQRKGERFREGSAPCSSANHNSSALHQVDYLVTN